MNLVIRNKILVVMFLSIAGLLSACGNNSNDSDNQSNTPVNLAPFFASLSGGAQENPPVLTAADGNANFTVDLTSGQITGRLATNEITTQFKGVSVISFAPRQKKSRWPL